jgi:hypothetical protein
MDSGQFPVCFSEFGRGNQIDNRICPATATKDRKLDINK